MRAISPHGALRMAGVSDWDYGDIARELSLLVRRDWRPRRMAPSTQNMCAGKPHGRIRATQDLPAPLFDSGVAAHVRKVD